MFAPAKLNLYLHITGRREDGYHNLDSLVAFASVGDEIRLEPAAEFEFLIEGPQAKALEGEDSNTNLVVKAARSLADLTGQRLDVKLTLLKHLPIASGIGGGSSDAAAALRALAEHWRMDSEDHRLFQAAAQHGQDVPACLIVQNNYLTATGIEPAGNLPHTHIVLVNPNKALPTPDVYKAYRANNAPFSPPAQLTKTPENVDDLVTELKGRHNDLYQAALHLMPDIGSVVGALERTAGCLLARMSGSGATCFGIYADRGAARNAASLLLAARPDWWVVPAFLPVRGTDISTDVS